MTISMLKLEEYDVGIDNSMFDERRQLIEVGGVNLLVGREKECEIIRRRVKMRYHSVIIHSPQGYGKTTMLRWAYDYINKQEGKIAVWANDIVKSESHYYYVIDKSILEHILHAPYFDNELKTYAKFKLIDLGKYSYGRGYTYEIIYKKILKALHESGFEDIYILGDDYNHFHDDKHLVLRNYLKAWFSREKDAVMWIITMETKNYRKLQKKDPAFLERFGERFMLHVLNDDEGVEIIRRRLQVAVNPALREKYGEWYPFTKAAVWKIAEQSGGMPRKILQYARIILDHALADDRLREGKLIDEEYVYAILHQRGLDIDTEVYKDLGEKAYAIVEYLKKCGGCAKLKDIRSTVRLSSPLLTYWLKKLMAEEFVVRKKHGIYCLLEEAEKVDELPRGQQD